MSGPGQAPAASAGARAEPPVLTENQIHERMVAAILDRRLPPGTKLVEDRLAAAFGVSRTRIRPVLVRLANEQVVTLSPNRGATVAQPTEQEAREVFQVRRLIEPTLVQCFIDSAGAEQVEQLAQCIADEEAARRSGDWRRAIRLSGDFHLLIAQAAGHQTLGRILRELVSRTSLVLMTWGPPPLHSTAPGAASADTPEAACNCAEHRGLLQAMKKRQVRQATQLMGDHLLQLESQLRFAVPEAATADLAALFGSLAASD